VGVLLVAVLVAVGVAMWTPPSHAPPRVVSASVQPLGPVATMRIPVSVPLSELAAAVEEKVPRVVVDSDDEQIGRDMYLDLLVTRTGDIEVRGVAGHIEISFPLHVVAAPIRAKRKAAGKPPGGAKVELTMRVVVAVTPTLDDAWNMTTSTVVSHQWIDKPKLQVGPIKVPVVKMVDKALSGMFTEIGPSIDARSAENDKTPAKVRAAWEALHEPRRVSDEPAVWFVAEPMALHASSPVIGEDAIELAVGVTGRFGLLVGEAPTPPLLLPVPPRTPPTANAGFELSVPVVLEWEALSALATEQVAGQTYDLPNAATRMKVLSAELYPSGESLAVGLTYEVEHPGWTTDGTLYLLGRPEVDADARAVVVRDFTYVVKTWDQSIAASNWVAQSGIEAAVADLLVFEWGPAADEALVEANTKLRDPPGDDKGKLTASLTAAGLGGIALGEEGLVVTLTLAGQASVVAKPELEDAGGIKPPSKSKGKKGKKIKRPRLPGDRR
jgi:hypothetical protein